MYCKQKLLLHKPFRTFQQLLNGYDSNITAYIGFLESGNVPLCLHDDITRLFNQHQQSSDDHNDDHELSVLAPVNRASEDWMAICTQIESQQPENTSTQPINWLLASQNYPSTNIQEASHFISRSKESLLHLYLV